jgi:hypothetical protein
MSIVKTIEDLPTYDRADALALADAAIINDTIAALQRDRNNATRSFTELELALADLRACVAARLANAIIGHVDLATVLLELEAVSGWEELT